jgi:hypothetical protein
LRQALAMEVPRHVRGTGDISDTGDSNCDNALLSLDADYSRSKAIQIASFLRDQTSMNGRFSSFTGGAGQTKQTGNHGNTNGDGRDNSNESDSSSDSETVERFSALLETLKVRPQSVRSVPCVVGHRSVTPSHLSALGARRDVNSVAANGQRSGTLSVTSSTVSSLNRRRGSAEQRLSSSPLSQVGQPLSQTSESQTNTSNSSSNGYRLSHNVRQSQEKILTKRLSTVIATNGHVDASKSSSVVQDRYASTDSGLSHGTTGTHSFHGTNATNGTNNGTADNRNSDCSSVRSSLSAVPTLPALNGRNNLRSFAGVTFSKNSHNTSAATDRNLNGTTNNTLRLSSQSSPFRDSQSIKPFARDSQHTRSNSFRDSRSTISNSSFGDPRLVPMTTFAQTRLHAADKRILAQTFGTRLT